MLLTFLSFLLCGTLLCFYNFNVFTLIPTNLVGWCAIGVVGVVSGNSSLPILLGMLAVSVGLQAGYMIAICARLMIRNGSSSVYEKTIVSSDIS